MSNVENFLQTKQGLELGEDGRKVLASRLSDRQTDRAELALESIGGRILLLQARGMKPCTDAAWM